MEGSEGGSETCQSFFFGPKKTKNKKHNPHPIRNQKKEKKGWLGWVGRSGNYLTERKLARGSLRAEGKISKIMWGIVLVRYLVGQKTVFICGKVLGVWRCYDRNL